MLFVCTGLSTAYEYAKIMHRDVSAGNILIDMNGNGVSIDWDLCCYTDDMSKYRNWMTVGGIHLGPCALIEF